MTVPYISGIFIYPIKSLDGVSVEKATILESGALKHDREWAIFDEQGNFVNGKRNAKVQLLRSTFGVTKLKENSCGVGVPPALNLQQTDVPPALNLQQTGVPPASNLQQMGEMPTLNLQQTGETPIPQEVDFNKLSLEIQGTDKRAVFDIKNEQTSLEAWLSDYFGFPVKCVQNTVSGFPDDTNASGPTVISTATIEEVASWFPEVSVEEMRLRLRANLEIGGVPAFWEDQLFTQAGQTVLFQVGDVLFHGVNPCQRCVVITRDSQTATATPQFQKIFVTQRQKSLPSWTTASRFNHFYRLSVNTNIPVTEAGKVLYVGDAVKIMTAYG